MLDYNDAKERADFLRIATGLIQSDIKGFHENFFKLCKSAKDTVEETLKKNNMSSMQDLLDKAVAELPPDEAEKYKAQLEELKPKNLVDIVAHPELKDVITAGLWLGDFIAVTAAFHYASQIKAGLDLQSKAFVELGPAYSRTIAMRAMAEEAGIAFQQAAAGNLTIEALDALILKFNNNTGNEIGAVQNQGMIEWEAERLADFSAAESVLASEGLNGAEALAQRTAAGARGMVRGGIYGLIAAGLLYAAVYGVTKWQEKKEAEALQRIIQKLATSRLYANQQKLVAIAYCSLPSIIEDIADAFVEKDEKELDKKLTKFIQKSRELAPSDDLSKSFATLADIDKDKKQKLDDDPDLPTMINIHKDKALEVGGQ